MSWPQFHTSGNKKGTEELFNREDSARSSFFTLFPRFYTLVYNVLSSNPELLANEVSTNQRSVIDDDRSGLWSSQGNVNKVVYKKIRTTLLKYLSLIYGLG